MNQCRYSTDFTFPVNQLINNSQHKNGYNAMNTELKLWVKIAEIYPVPVKVESALLQFVILYFQPQILNTVLVWCCWTKQLPSTEHQILLSHQENRVDIQDAARGRSFCVCVGAIESYVEHFKCGVPQASILVSFLFSLHLLPLWSILCKHAFTFHLYSKGSYIYCMCH